MNYKKPLINILLSTFLIAALSAASIAQASETTSSSGDSNHPSTESGELYLPTENAMADLEEALNSARESDRLLLVIMGANWCHDSRALAARVHKEPLSTTINKHYEILFVDVGYLESGKEVITSLGSPAYYATPTVLIVDPVSGQLINALNRHQWANADSISMEESIGYFQQFANTDLTALQNGPEVDAGLQQLLEEIDTFEQAQADRLYQAYAVLAPMLRAYKAGDKEAFSEETWNEVRDFRYKVPTDMDALRTEARERAAAGETDITLTYPVYPAFSFEQQ